MKKDASKVTTIKQHGHYSVVGPTTLYLRVADTDKVSKFTHDGFRFSQRRYSVIRKGKIRDTKNTPVRISSNCQWSFYFDNQYCDCRWQLEKSKEIIDKEGHGLAIFAHDQHGKGVGIEDHWKVYAEGQAHGLELVVDAYERLGYKEDYRDYDDIRDILNHYEIKSIHLLSNNPRRANFLRRKGFQVKRIRLEQPLNEYLKEEYRSKKLKLNHLLKADFK